MPRCHIGTSGWSYRHWQDCFYGEIPSRDWLMFYAQHFSALEINGSFYRLQTAETLRKWFDQTPAAFRFALKANHYLTHNKKLYDPEASVLIEKNHAQALGEKLAAVLWQLPASFKKDFSRLTGFVDALQIWHEVRHCIEFRHASWFDDETAGCLAKGNIASCISDAQSWPRWERVISDLVYVRLHGHLWSYKSCYADSELAEWADRVAAWLRQGKDVQVYFNNDAECAAPLNALALQTLLKNLMPSCCE